MIFMNRLWFRFSVSIVLVVFVILVMPTASLLLIERQDIYKLSQDAIYEVDYEAELELTSYQVNTLAYVWAEDTRQTFVDDFQYLLITTLVVGVIAGGILGRRLSLPFERLVNATKAVASKELGHRVEVEGAKEITDLADNFNEMIAALAHSERLRRNMMADVSHELLTPLTVLQGNLRAILDDVYELNKDEIGTLYEQNKHLIRLVKDLRQLAQAEAGQLPYNITAVSLNALTQDMATFFVPAAETKNITITQALTLELPSINGDADRLRQVLHNLMANALRHTPPGGEITVRTQKATNEIWISVSDTGDGIDPTLLPHVFDRFYRTSETRRRDSGGAGLGLAISKAIVTAHNGRISAASPGQGKGTTFTIYLPIPARDA